MSLLSPGAKQLHVAAKELRVIFWFDEDRWRHVLERQDSDEWIVVAHANDVEQTSTDVFSPVFQEAVAGEHLGLDGTLALSGQAMGIAFSAVVKPSHDALRVNFDLAARLTRPRKLLMQYRLTKKHNPTLEILSHNSTVEFREDCFHVIPHSVSDAAYPCTLRWNYDFKLTQ